MVPSQLRFIDRDKDKARFFSTLRQRVDAYFKENKISRHANWKMVLKTCILLSGYILPFVALLIFQPSFLISMLIWTIMGFSLAGIGMSVMHDANHGAYSSSHRTNRWLGHSLNLLGASVYNWKLQHNLLHHTYTNIVTHDLDIQDKAILRFSPHTEVKWYHRLQAVYAIFFYGITTLYWALVKDFLQFVKYKRDGINKNSKKENAILLTRMVFDKVLYLFVILILPVWLFKMKAAAVISGFLVMHFVAGVVLTIIFQLAHTVEGTTHPLADENGTIENNWAIHQMNTTVNFSRNSRFISWYVGGLNFQIEHHLFPTICHVHYPYISDIVKNTADEFGVPYMENTTFSEALVSHLNTLRRFGRLPDINEVLA